jgi:hypothetical protein
MATTSSLSFFGEDEVKSDNVPYFFEDEGNEAPSSSGSGDFNPDGDDAPTSTEIMMVELGIDTRDGNDFLTTFPVVRKRHDDELESTECKDISLSDLNNIAFRCESMGRQGMREFPIYGIENPFQRNPYHSLYGAKLYITVESTSPWVLRQVKEAYDSYMAKQQLA